LSIKKKLKDMAELTGTEENDPNGKERGSITPFQDEQDLEQSLPEYMFHQQH
jgi:hypothetical protein